MPVKYAKKKWNFFASPGIFSGSIEIYCAPPGIYPGAPGIYPAQLLKIPGTIPDEF